MNFITLLFASTKWSILYFKLGFMKRYYQFGIKQTFVIMVIIMTIMCWNSMRDEIGLERCNK